MAAVAAAVSERKAEPDREALYRRQREEITAHTSQHIRVSDLSDHDESPCRLMPCCGVSLFSRLNFFFFWICISRLVTRTNDCCYCALLQVSPRSLEFDAPLLPHLQSFGRCHFFFACFFTSFYGNKFTACI